MKHLIIFNPSAGKGKDGASFEEVIKNNFEGLDYEIYKTEGPRKVIPFLKAYFKKNNKGTVRVYACGGDGTVHEVANGLVGIKNAELKLYDHMRHEILNEDDKLTVYNDILNFIKK